MYGNSLSSRSLRSLLSYCHQPSYLCPCFTLTRTHILEKVEESSCKRNVLNWQGACAPRSSGDAGTSWLSPELRQHLHGSPGTRGRTRAQAPPPSSSDSASGDPLGNASSVPPSSAPARRGPPCLPHPKCVELLGRVD